MNWLNWLYPGLGVKRWFLVIFAAMFLAAEGLVMIVAHADKSAWWIMGLALILAGFYLAFFGMGRLMKNIFLVVMPEKDFGVREKMLQRYQLRRGPRIVALGGGTGLSTLLRGLKELTSNLTAIVTVTDDGGSSGRLRGDLGIPPPGDIRNCLVALADREEAMADLFNYRFTQESGLAGHSLGNLLIAGLTETSGDFASAVEMASRVLAVRGQVLPVTVDVISLQAEMKDGRQVAGETKIVSDPAGIKRVFLCPADSHPLPAAVTAILAADAVILGPGSLYTSVIPNLLVPGIIPAIVRSRATVYYICNIMTQPGETDGYMVSQHVQAIIDHCGMNIIDYVIVNQDVIGKKLRRLYAAKGASPVLLDRTAVERLPVQVLAESLSSQQDFARHDAAKLVNLLNLAIQTKSSGLFRLGKRLKPKRRSHD